MVWLQPLRTSKHPLIACNPTKQSRTTKLKSWVSNWTNSRITAMHTLKLLQNELAALAQKLEDTHHHLPPRSYRKINMRKRIIQNSYFCWKPTLSKFAVFKEQNDEILNYPQNDLKVMQTGQTDQFACFSLFHETDPNIAALLDKEPLKYCSLWNPRSFQNETGWSYSEHQQ